MKSKNTIQFAYSNEVIKKIQTTIKTKVNKTDIKNDIKIKLNTTTYLNELDIIFSYTLFDK